MLTNPFRDVNIHCVVNYSRSMGLAAKLIHMRLCAKTLIGLFAFYSKWELHSSSVLFNGKSEVALGTLDALTLLFSKRQLVLLLL